MKCNKAQQWILLLKSGELNRSKTNKLSLHIKSCLDCKEYAADMDSIHLLMDQTSTVSPTPDYILHSIKQAGRIPHHAAEKAPFVFIWRPVAVAAASILLVLAGWTLMHQSSQTVQQVASVDPAAAESITDWDNGIDDELEELENMLVIASYELQEADPAYEWYEEDADELAAELLYTEESS